MRIAVVGAGLAGLACAWRLQQAGHAPALFDKGRGPGGRMATRRIATPLGEAVFDHGAQYFTARDPAFAAEVAQWHRDGLVAPWPAAGGHAWVGTPAMNAPLKHLASLVEVRFGATVTGLEREGGRWRVRGKDVDEAGFDAAVVAVPAEQAAPLLATADPAAAALAAATRSEPCWTVMAAFADRLPVSPDVVRAGGAVDWAARNSAKPARGGPESWVVHASPEWSRQRLEETPETIFPRLLEEFFTEVGQPPLPPLAGTAHRWRYARSGAAGPDALWNLTLALGACGDWLLGPRVECAWLSGHRLAALITEDRTAG